MSTITTIRPPKHKSSSYYHYDGGGNNSTDKVVIIGTIIVMAGTIIVGCILDKKERKKIEADTETETEYSEPSEDTYARVDGKIKPLKIIKIKDDGTMYGFLSDGRICVSSIKNIVICPTYQELEDYEIILAKPASIEPLVPDKAKKLVK